MPAGEVSAIGHFQAIAHADRLRILGWMAVTAATPARQVR
jgi:hypothetical protein